MELGVMMIDPSGQGVRWTTFSFTGGSCVVKKSTVSTMVKIRIIQNLGKIQTIVLLVSGFDSVKGTSNIFLKSQIAG